MQQVFLNIIVNAESAMLEAHGKGKLVIATEKVNGVIRVTFADDGPGITKENMKRIFAPFFTTKEVGKGTGLGLSICHGIVTGHGGRIYAESEFGQGATFVVELPLNGH
jgi:signal transduction histidine kinase